MGQGKEYFCTLQPVEPYFLGGERNFHFGPVQEEGKADYYLISEDLPQQSSLFGMLRFLILEKTDMLSSLYYGEDEEKRAASAKRNDGIAKEQAALVGEEGFRAERQDVATDYGKLHDASPLFLAREAEDGLHLLVRTPLNHRTGESSYRPFKMQGGFHTELGADTLLPADYVAKNGLADSFLDLMDGSIHERSEIFEEEERTRIGRGLEEKGYFKMRYKMLRKGWLFAFFCHAEDGVLPDAATAYLGQGKSTFAFRAEAAPALTLANALGKIRSLPGAEEEHISVYFAVSDAFLNLTHEVQGRLAYSIVETVPFRSLVENAGAAAFVSSRKKSPLYQLVRAGSVFYVRDDETEAFEKAFRKAGLQQAGFNMLENLGGVH